MTSPGTARGLAVEHLVAGYRRRPIARLATLAIAPGEAGVLAGASGSGKTTLLLAVAGLSDRLEGTIRLGGETLDTLTPRARDRHRGRHVGMIFQDLHLVPGLSALDNMRLAPWAAGAVVDPQAPRALLERLGLGARVDARAETLSRGEAQRVAIARAALMRPALLLADEPTASLDDAAAGAVIDLLLDTARDTGAALLVATHDARVRARIAVVAEAHPA